MSITHADLKARQRAEREDHPEGLALRVHRSLSWLERAEQCTDADGKFIFLWIAFNAAYASEVVDGARIYEKESFGKFLGKLVDLDTDGVLSHLIWKEFSGSIRVLLNNQFVFDPFWEFHRGNISEGEWKSRFESAKTGANNALGKQQTAEVLSIVLTRMYTLRNQLMHGGATWNSKVNRDQLTDCVNFLGKLVPQVIKIMLDNTDTIWGDAVYPVV